MPPSIVFGLFFVAFVAIGLMWVLKPREMMRFNIRTRHGVEGDIEPSDTRVRFQRIAAILVLIAGAGIMLSWMGGF